MGFAEAKQCLLTHTTCIASHDVFTKIICIFVCKWTNKARDNNEIVMKLNVQYGEV